MSSGMKKAPRPGGAISNRITNNLKDQTMGNSIREQFDARIQVAGFTVAPNVLTGGTEPDENVVTLRATGLQIKLTPSEACSLAAALQAVAVHQLEQAPRSIRRLVEPGSPELNGVGGGL